MWTPSHRIRKKVLPLACIMLFVVVGAEIPSRIRISKSPSLNHFMFIRISGIRERDVTLGRYVSYPLHTDLFKECHPCEVTKRVGCDEGRNLRTVVDGTVRYYCDDRLLGVAKPYSKAGKPLAAFHFTGTVPRGHFFAVGDSPDSYDSRYYGFVKKAAVSSINHPVL